MWRDHAVVVLCAFGFFKEFRPSDSFLTSYLVSSSKNFTQEEVSQEIYPYGTYSTLFLLIAVFLVTDALRYKPVILIQGLAGVATYCFLIWGANLSLIQVCEVFYGLFIASDVAYSTYIYTSCEKDAYRRATSYSRIAVLSGRFLSGLLGQFLVSLQFSNYDEINYITLISLCMAVLSAFLLPSVSRSLYFHHSLPSDDMGSSGPPVHHKKEKTQGGKASLNDYKNLSDHFEKLPINGNYVDDLAPPTVIQMPNVLSASMGVAQSGLSLIWIDFYSSYLDYYVLKWSLWWALTHCGYLQVSSYIQNQWQNTAEKFGGQLYNGAANSVYAITGILATWAVGRVGVQLDISSNWLLANCALIAGALVIWAATSQSLLLQYVIYGNFKVLYQVMMTLANSEVSKSLKRDSHGLVFGFNTFVALLLQTVLTAVVVGKGGLELELQTQFFVYGVYFCLIGVGFGTVGLLHSFQRCCKTEYETDT